MASKSYQYVEALSEFSTASATFVDVTSASISFTPDASSDYYIFASCDFNVSSTLQSGTLQLTDTITGFAVPVFRPNGASDYTSMALSGKFTTSALPGLTTYKIQLKTSGGTAKVKNVRIFILKADPVDKYGESLTRLTSVSTTYVDSATTGSFTPATSGDYLLVAIAEIDIGSSGAQGFLCIDVDGTTYGELAISSNIATRYGCGIVKRVTLSNAAHTVKSRVHTSSGVFSVGHQNSRIFAIRLTDNVDNNYNTDTTARATTTSATFSLFGSQLSASLSALNYLVMASSASDGSSSVAQCMGAQLNEDSGTLLDTMTSSAASTSAKFPFFTVYKKTYTAATHTWQIEQRAPDGASTDGMQTGVIEVVQLDASAVVASSTITDTPSALLSDGVSGDEGVFSF